MSALIITWCATRVWSQDAAQLGNTAFEEGRYTEAATHYKQALSNKPSFAIHVNLGHAYMRLEQWTDAATSYRGAIELDPASATPEVWLFLGQAHYQNKDYEEALDAFLEVTLSSSNRQANLWIARCLIELEQWLRAKFTLLAHLGVNPKDLEALGLLAHVYVQMGDWPGAIATYRDLLATTPDRTAYRLALANALAISGQNQQAIDTLELAWRIDSGATEKTNRLLADLYLAEAMPHEAALCYARVIRHEGRPSADDCFRLGMAYFQGREFVSARETLGRMRQIDPTDFRADLHLGHIAVEEHRPGEASEHFEAALARDPTSGEALLALAQLEMQQKQYAKAAIHFAGVIESGDQRPSVYYDHVLALLHSSEETEPAKAALKAALARHPSEAPLQQLLDRYIRRTHPSPKDR